MRIEVAGMEKKRKEKDFVNTQEGLDEYIRVSRPSVIVVIISLLIVLVAVIVWGVVGTLPVTETVTGLVIDKNAYKKVNSATIEHRKEWMAIDSEKDMTEPDSEEDDRNLIFCFVDASRYNGQAIQNFGEEAIVKMPDQTTFSGTIENYFSAPISSEEVKHLLFNNEWVQQQCVQQEYNWWLIIRPNEDISAYSFTLAEVTLLTGEVAPIRLLMN